MKVYRDYISDHDKCTDLIMRGKLFCTFEENFDDRNLIDVCAMVTGYSIVKLSNDEKYIEWYIEPLGLKAEMFEIIYGNVQLKAQVMRMRVSNKVSHLWITR